MHQAEQEGTNAHWPIQEATSKVEEIISQAESAAGGILDSAEIEAERYVREVCNDSEREALEHARALSELSDSLVAHAEVLSRQSRLILEQLSAFSAGGNGHAAGSYETETDAQRPDRNPPQRGAPAMEPVAAPDEPVSLAQHQAPADSPSVVDSYSAGARLLATQMAVAGSGRAEIRDRLVNDFGIHNPDPLLDALLGRI